MGVNRTEQTLSSRKATNSRVAPLRGATLGGWLLYRLYCMAFVHVPLPGMARFDKVGEYNYMV